MAKVLTPEQREAKRARDKAYRERKAANVIQTITIPADQIEEYKVTLDSKVEDAMKDLFAGKITKEQFGKIAADNPGCEVEKVEVTQPMKISIVADPVATALVGQTVLAPVTGLNAVVAKTFRSGGRLLTEDGEHMWANTCPHSTEEREAKGTIVFFEQYGTGNRDFADGTKGFVHRFSRCNKVISL